jgi:hypothetical protein
MPTVIAIYGALLSTVLAAGRAVAWLSGARRRLAVRMFLSPLAVDGEGRVRVRNKKGHPSIQEGEAWEFVVIRAHNIGKRTVQVARVEVQGHGGTKENLSYLPMPSTIAPDEIQLWYSKSREIGSDVRARVTLTDGKVFESPCYSNLHAFMSPVDPIAGEVGNQGDMWALG